MIDNLRPPPPPPPAIDPRQRLVIEIVGPQQPAHSHKERLLDDLVECMARPSITLSMDDLVDCIGIAQRVNGEAFVPISAAARLAREILRLKYELRDLRATYHELDALALQIGFERAPK